MAVVALQSFLRLLGRFDMYPSSTQLFPTQNIVRIERVRAFCVLCVRCMLDDCIDVVAVVDVVALVDVVASRCR
jgi:hypothetical protein